MIYLGTKETNPYKSKYFYNIQTNYIYIIYSSDNIHGNKWQHIVGSDIEELSTEDYEYPFNELFLANKLENDLIPSDDGVDIYYRLEKIIDKIIFDDISW